MPDLPESEMERLREENRRLRAAEERLRQDLVSAQNGHDQGAPPGPQTPAAPPPAAKQAATKEAPSGSRIGRLAREHPARLAIIVGILVALLIGGWFVYQYMESYESTDDAYIDGHIDPVSSRISGTVIGVYVHENESVTAGQKLVDLDPQDYKVALEHAQAAYEQAQAQIQAANPTVPITAATSHTGIETAQANVLSAESAVAAAERDREVELGRLAQAEANSANAQSELARYKKLVAKDEVSQLQYDTKETAARSAAAAVASERAAVAAAEKVIDQRRAQLSQAQAQSREASQTAPHQVAIQRAGVQSRVAAAASAKSAVDQAQLNLQYTTILAPISGVVGRKSVEVGQRVSAGQELMAIVPLNDIWVTANFKETQLRKMHPGQSVTIHVDAFDEDYQGYVDSLPPASGEEYSVIPPENASGNFVKVVQRLPVRIRFKPGQDKQHRLRPGMSVEPKVWLQ
jgi:membrane fusion protein, multidrug efflux system